MSIALGEMQKAIDELVKKANRPGRTGADGKPEDETAIAHGKAFNGFMRKGADEGLAELQVKSLSISVQGDGGFAVPQDLDRQIIAVEANATPMRGICNVRSPSRTRRTRSW
jgi:HK97 family phage major capsid protein